MNEHKNENKILNGLMTKLTNKETTGVFNKLLNARQRARIEWLNGQSNKLSAILMNT